MIDRPIYFNTVFVSPSHQAPAFLSPSEKKSEKGLKEVLESPTWQEWSNTCLVLYKGLFATYHLFFRVRKIALRCVHFIFCSFSMWSVIWGVDDCKLALVLQNDTPYSRNKEQLSYHKTHPTWFQTLQYPAPLRGRNTLAKVSSNFTLLPFHWRWCLGCCHRQLWPGESMAELPSPLEGTLDGDGGDIQMAPRERTVGWGLDGAAKVILAENKVA